MVIEGEVSSSRGGGGGGGDHKRLEVREGQYM